MLNIDLLVGIFSSGKLDTEPLGNYVENFSSLVNKKLANNGQQALIFICFKVQKRKPSSKKPIFVDWFGVPKIFTDFQKNLEATWDKKNILPKLNFL